MYTGLGAFNFSGLLKQAQTAVQKVQATAKKVKQSAEQFLPLEATKTVQTASGEVLTEPASIPESAATANALSSAGLPVIPLALAGAGLAFFLLKRKKGRK